jgi:hypothetical protein
MLSYEKIEKLDDGRIRQAELHKKNRGQKWYETTYQLGVAL